MHKITGNENGNGLAHRGILRRTSRWAANVRAGLGGQRPAYQRPGGTTAGRFVRGEGGPQQQGGTVRSTERTNWFSTAT